MMVSAMRHTKMIPVFLLVLMSACTSTDKSVTDAVMKYNRMLVEAYRTNDADKLKEAAGPDEIRKVTALIDINRMKEIYLDSKLMGLRIVKTERPSTDTALVWTEEEWEYAYRNIADDSVKDELKSERYEMVYFLGKSKKVWVVEKLKWQHEYTDQEKEE